MELNELKYSPGSRRKRRRKGRGPGSGRGKTAGRGEKGQKSRAGARLRVGFEGGQMPLIRRLPKIGFTSSHSYRPAVVNISVLNRFSAGTEVTPEVLLRERIIRKLGDGVKILGEGTLEKELIVQAHGFSRKARRAIEAAGGSCQLIATGRTSKLKKG